MNRINPSYNYFVKFNYCLFVNNLSFKMNPTGDYIIGREKHYHDKLRGQEQYKKHIESVVKTAEFPGNVYEDASKECDTKMTRLQLLIALLDGTAKAEDLCVIFREQDNSFFNATEEEPSKFGIMMNVIDSVITSFQAPYYANCMSCLSRQTYLFTKCFEYVNLFFKSLHENRWILNTFDDRHYHQAMHNGRLEHVSFIAIYNTNAEDINVAKCLAFLKDNVPGAIYNIIEGYT